LLVNECTRLAHLGTENPSELAIGQSTTSDGWLSTHPLFGQSSRYDRQQFQLILRHRSTQVYPALFYDAKLDLKAMP
jgi:hypothetical protein